MMQSFALDPPGTKEAGSTRNLGVGRQDSQSCKPQMLRKTGCCNGRDGQPTAGQTRLHSGLEPVLRWCPHTGTGSYGLAAGRRYRTY